MIGQLTVDESTAPGYVTAYGCDDGIADAAGGAVTRSDLNYDGHVTPVASNRLIVQADADGDICFRTTAAADLIVDVNGVSGVGHHVVPEPAHRHPHGDHDARTARRSTACRCGRRTTPLPALDGIAALTGLPAGADVTEPTDRGGEDRQLPARRARSGASTWPTPCIEVNVEGVTRFVALFQTNLPRGRPGAVGPHVDLDLLTAMNRPVFAYLGGQPGVDAVDRDRPPRSGVLVDFSAQRTPCYRRSPIDPARTTCCSTSTCAVGTRDRPPARRDRCGTSSGAGRRADRCTSATDTTFTVPMDGVRVEWTWDPASGHVPAVAGRRRHVAASGARIAAGNVVELATSTSRRRSTRARPNPITVGSGVGVVHRDGRHPGRRGRRRPPTTSSCSTTPRPVRSSRSTSASRSSNSNASRDGLGAPANLR